MNRSIRLLFAFALGLSAAACGTEQASAPTPEQPAPAQANADAAPLQDGVQVVRITVGPTGYRPQRVQLREGVPARLLFERTAGSACSEHVQIPSLGIERTPLPLGEPVAVEFTPTTSGSFAFLCGMDMLEGTLVVADRS
jgi:plastocyanin domain-containing protein